MKLESRDDHHKILLGEARAEDDHEDCEASADSSDYLTLIQIVFPENLLIS